MLRVDASHETRDVHHHNRIQENHHAKRHLNAWGVDDKAVAANRR
ncbi:hypothetical protein [Litchfieldella rifensis]|uniref:Uncharacterized protein n=1 Tax=Litchfieldella rifensis TaxID=762643 RepID=A0ABV7LVV9_9GAMM